MDKDDIQPPFSLVSIAQEAFAARADKLEQAIDRIPQGMGNNAQSASHVIFVLCTPSGVGHMNPPLFDLYQKGPNEQGADFLLIAYNGAKLAINRANKTDMESEQYDLSFTSANGHVTKSIFALDAADPLPKENDMMAAMVRWASENCPPDKKSHFIDLVSDIQVLVNETREESAQLRSAEHAPGVK